MASSGRRRVDSVNVRLVASTPSRRWRLALAIRTLVATGRVDWRFYGLHVLDDSITESRSRKNTRRERHEKNRKKNTQVLVLLEPEEVSHAAQRAKPNYFDLVLGHDAAAVAAARGKASAPFAHGGTWVPRAVWAAPPRRKAPKASLVCGALQRPKYTKLVSRGDGVVLSILRELESLRDEDTTQKRRRQGPHARPPYQKSGLGRRRRGRSNRALRLRTFKATA